MFQLQLVQLTGTDREREIEADLRRRQLLKAAADVAACRPARPIRIAPAPHGRAGPARPGPPALSAPRCHTTSSPPARSAPASWPSRGCTAASCGTTLEGDFSVGRFGRLNRDQLTLLESFLRSRGNLREMERELGISYPTVRSRVEALVRALGFGPRADADDAPMGPREVTAPGTREEILAGPGAPRDERGGCGRSRSGRSAERRREHRDGIAASNTRSASTGCWRSAFAAARSACGPWMAMLSGSGTATGTISPPGSRSSSVPARRPCEAGAAAGSRDVDRAVAARISTSTCRAGRPSSSTGRAPGSRSTGLAGDQRYRSISGDITLHGVSGTISVDAVSGDVDITTTDRTGV